MGDDLGDDDVVAVPPVLEGCGSAAPSDRTPHKEIARVHRPSVSALLGINKQHRLSVSDLIVLSARSKEGKCGVGSHCRPVLKSSVL